MLKRDNIISINPQKITEKYSERESDWSDCQLLVFRLLHSPKLEKKVFLEGLEQQKFSGR